MIGTLKQVAYRYEWAYMRDISLIERSARQHEAIIAALREQNLELVEEQLAAHWQAGMNTLLEQLDWL
jgi:DNA-binding GntR family transcriptional regulator